MNTSSSSAPSASSKSKAMIGSWKAAASLKRPRGLRPSWRKVSIIAIAAFMAACTSVPLPPASTPGGASVPAGVRPGDAGPLPPPRLLGKSRWVAVHWSELPGFEEDSLFEAWNAWIKSCERPGPVFAPLCSEVRRLSIASAQEQRDWMVARLQPYRVESLQGSADGLLTSYYEPVLKASRRPGGGYAVPVYRTPATLGSRKPWFSRQEIDTLPEARAALQGREIAWVDNPVEVMSLHIQGSGRLNILEPDGSQRVVRVAYAGSNEQPFRSVTQWLADQGEGKMLAPWVESTKVWAFKNPQRVQQMLWSNPRYTFFQEQPLSEFDAAFGPKGAQGVPLTPGRSIAVDPGSIPYGTPVWLASRGGAANLQKLVLAQDTGSAIVGAVRADYFAGTGVDAGLLASRVNQPLRLWALWPK
ncbi:MltA domain-containing protein [Polaromonas sp.]|uniref:murein transglycosylase A n=1 Tax=Polaromonas sp. TaxID=1869339 RepID=UPI0013BACD21|nr:MltA domain-containing protein [Polaromonas sp.]NDP62496.1 transglycosylase [Polaromonas sp.]